MHACAQQAVRKRECQYQRDEKSMTISLVFFSRFRDLIDDNTLSLPFSPHVKISHGDVECRTRSVDYIHHGASSMHQSHPSRKPVSDINLETGTQDCTQAGSASLLLRLPKGETRDTRKPGVIPPQAPSNETPC